MNNQVTQFNANRNALVIPSEISQIINAKAKDGKTFEGGEFTICTFKAFAANMGVEKPIKGGERSEWNECKRVYNDAKLSASRWYREQMGRALADQTLAGQKMGVKLFRSKDGSVRRKVSFELADPTKSDRKVKTVRLTTREQVEAAAAQLGYKLVDAEQGELTLA
jgi:hypothetical protein